MNETKLNVIFISILIVIIFQATILLTNLKYFNEESEFQPETFEEITIINNTYTIIQSENKPFGFIDYLGRVNVSIQAVSVNYPSIVIPMNTKNFNEMERHINHEYLHQLIRSDKMCGNTTCRIHFCKY